MLNPERGMPGVPPIPTYEGATCAGGGVSGLSTQYLPTPLPYKGPVYNFHLWFFPPYRKKHNQDNHQIFNLVDICCSRSGSNSVMLMSSSACNNISMGCGVFKWLARWTVNVQSQV
jgi:hypothetical protein